MQIFTELEEVTDQIRVWSKVLNSTGSTFRQLLLLSCSSQIQHVEYYATIFGWCGIKTGKILSFRLCTLESVFTDTTSGGRKFHSLMDLGKNDSFLLSNAPFGIWYLFSWVFLECLVGFLCIHFVWSHENW
jgi:hypothetical protein